MLFYAVPLCYSFKKKGRAFGEMFEASPTLLAPVAVKPPAPGARNSGRAPAGFGDARPRAGLLDTWAVKEESRKSMESSWGFHVNLEKYGLK